MDLEAIQGQANFCLQNDYLGCLDWQVRNQDSWLLCPIISDWLNKIWRRYLTS